MRLALSAAFLCGLSVSQSPNLASIGSWQLIQPSPSSASQGPVGSFNHQPTVAQGAFVVAGNISSTSTGAFQFDIPSLAWTAFPAIDGSYLAHLFTYGGWVVATSEQGDKIALLPLDDFSSGWILFPYVPGAPALTPPAFRWHGRKAVFGSLLFFFGGVDNTALPSPHFYNDLYALDLNRLVQVAQAGAGPGTPDGWVNVIVDGTPGMPSGRAGFNFIPYGYHLWIINGLTANGVVNEVWSFTPGSRQSSGPLGPANPSFSPALFTSWPVSSVLPGGNVPALWEATASVYGDHAFVYAGFNQAPAPGAFAPPAASASGSLWIYTFPTGQWLEIPAGTTAPWPQPKMGWPMPSGATLGRHLIVMVTDATTGVQQLWTWAANPFFTPPPAAQSVLQEILQPGIAVGVAFAVLLGIAQVGFTVYQWRKSGGGAVVNYGKVGDAYEEMGRL